MSRQTTQTEKPGKLELRLDQLGRKFYNNWLFRDLNLDLSNLGRLAIIGTNGSGKSTLLRLLTGQLSPTEGKVSYLINGKNLPVENWIRYFSWSGAAIEPYPALTATEHLRLHFSFKTPLIPPQEILSVLDLTQEKDKPLRVYSSGMLQRFKIGLALFTQSELLLLDEPTSNMDQQNADKILGLIDDYSSDRLLVIASNLQREYSRFPHHLRLG